MNANFPPDHENAAFLPKIGPESSAASQPKRLLAIGNAGPDLLRLKQYAVELGRRIGCQVVLVSLDEGLSQASDCLSSSHMPAAAGDRPNELLEYKLAGCNAKSAVELLNQSLKRIEFFLTDSDDIKELLSETVQGPVFRIEDSPPLKGGLPMSGKPDPGPKNVNFKNIGVTAAFGALTIALYAALFIKSGAVMRLFTRGGFYAALPIATAFIFSFVHGAFASHLWSLLGIQAKTRTEAYKSVAARPQPAKSKPKRPRAYAHVNPFHNIDLKGK